MQSLGMVLERLHAAWADLNTAQGTMRIWYQPGRTQQVWERWRDTTPPGSRRLLQPSGPQADVSAAATRDGDDAEPYREHFYRFWMAKPWRWRIEQFVEDPQKSAARAQQIRLIDGSLWWDWIPGITGGATNATGAHTTQTRLPDVDRALLVMLEPAPLMGTLSMRVEQSVRAIGHRADVVICAPRDPQADPGLWPGADQYRLLVDRQHGTVLRAEALLEDGVFAGSAFTDLLLNQAHAEDRFSPPPPALDS